MPTGTPLIGASNAGGVAKNAILNEYRCIYCIQVYSVVHRIYESQSVKNKAATDGVEPSTYGGVRRSLFSQDDDEVFVTGSTLYAGDTTHPGHNPLGHNSVFCCRIGNRTS